MDCHLHAKNVPTDKILGVCTLSSCLPPSGDTQYHAYRIGMYISDYTLDVGGRLCERGVPPRMSPGGNWELPDVNVLRALDGWKSCWVKVLKMYLLLCYFVQVLLSLWILKYSGYNGCSLINKFHICVKPLKAESLILIVLFEIHFVVSRQNGKTRVVVQINMNIIVIRVLMFPINLG